MKKPNTLGAYRKLALLLLPLGIPPDGGCGLDGVDLPAANAYMSATDGML